MVNRILRKPEVKELTGLSNTTLYAKIASGTFPRPIKLTDRAVGWLAADVQAWISDRIQASRPESVVEVHAQG